MQAKIYSKYQELIYSKSGIFLGDNKIPLLSARIGKRIRALGLSGYEHYYDVIASDTSNRELTELINSISTNVTSFFREAHQFECLARFLGDRNCKSSNSEKVKIWCAAASTGEEPYTIAFTLLNQLVPHEKIEIIASDISTIVLSKAKQGIYCEDAVKQLHPQVVKSYFRVGIGRASKLYRVKAEIRQLVQFRHINLSVSPFPIEPNLDFIFCRNVMIYFKESLRIHLIDNFASLLKPGGYLFVGSSESIFGNNKKFQHIGPSIYRKCA